MSNTSKRDGNYIAGLRQLTDTQLANRAYAITLAACEDGMPDSFLRATFAAIADEVKRRIGNTAPTENHTV